MWVRLIITAYAAIIVVLTGAAGWIALSMTDHRRATRAVTVLKILIGATLGSGGALVLFHYLDQAGLA